MRALAKLVLWGAVAWLAAPLIAALWIMAAAVGIELVDRLGRLVRNDGA